MINKLPNNNLDLQATSVYDFNELTLQELLCKFFSKINECVDVSNQALNFLTWLKEEGLPIEVQKEIKKMYLDGRLTEIINQLANDVKGQVQEIKTDLTNHKTEYEQFKTSTNETLTSHTSQLEQIAQQTVYYYLNNSNKLKLGNTIITKGFYSENDTKTSIYKINSIVGNESFIDLGNGVLVGNDCSIKLNDTLKLKLLVDNNEVDIKQLGAISNDKNISNEVIINYIFKNYKTALITDKFYIKGSIIHQNNSVLKGLNKNLSQITLSDNVNQYPIKSPNYNFDSFTMLFDEFVLEDITIDGNYTTNNKRNLTGNVNTGYYGAGTVICNVKDYRVNRVKIQNTEAWGLSFFLCKNLYVDDLEFNQKVGNGSNKDGISGSCENAYVNNVYGYTDDDLVAFTTGRGSIGGVSTGVNINIKQNNIIVDNVRGIQKDGVSPWCGVCIYGTNTEIKNISISNVIGDFQLYAFRFGDYWYTDTITLYIKNLSFSKCYVSAINSNIIYKILHCNIDNLTIDKSEFVETNMTEDKAMVDFVGCNIGNLNFLNSTVIANSSDTNKYYLFQQLDSNVNIKNFKCENILTNKLNSNDLTNTQFCYFKNCECVTILNNKIVSPSNNFYQNFYYIENNHSLNCDMSFTNNFLVNDSDIVINSLYSTFVGSSLSIFFDLTINNIQQNNDRILLKTANMLNKIKFYHHVQVYFGKPSTTGLTSHLIFDKDNKVLKMLNPNLNNTTVGTTTRISGSMIIPTTFR